MKRYKRQKVVYNGQNFILTMVKKGEKDDKIVILCTDFSLHDPISLKCKPMYNNCTILGMYFKDDDPERKKLTLRRRIIYRLKPERFGCKGLKQAGEELATFINNLEDEKEVVLQFIAKSARMTFMAEFNETLLKKEKVKTVALSVPFLGTKAVNKQETKECLNKLEFHTSEQFSSHHIIDDEIATGMKLEKLVFPPNLTLISSSLFLENYFDYPVSFYERINPINLFFEFLAKKLEKSENTRASNGIITLKSQEAIATDFRIYASLANTFSNKHVKELVQKIIDE